MKKNLLIAASIFLLSSTSFADYCSDTYKDAGQMAKCSMGMELAKKGKDGKSCPHAGKKATKEEHKACVDGVHQGKKLAKEEVKVTPETKKDSAVKSTANKETDTAAPAVAPVAESKATPVTEAEKK